MAKVDLLKLKGVTKTNTPIEKTITWGVEATVENIEYLKEASKNKNLQVGELVEVEGQAFIRRISFRDQEEIIKSYQWDVDKADPENTKLKGVNGIRLQAARILGSVCADATGTPFFKTIDDVLDCDIMFCNALYVAADEVNNFMGKLVKKNSNETNSSVNSSSTESAAEPLKKPSKK